MKGMEEVAAEKLSDFSPNLVGRSTHSPRKGRKRNTVRSQGQALKNGIFRLRAAFFTPAWLVKILL
jgi:hypothetical protein